MQASTHDPLCKNCPSRVAKVLQEESASEAVVIDIAEVKKATSKRLQSVSSVSALCTDCEIAVARFLAKNGARASTIAAMTDFSENKAKEIWSAHAPKETRSNGQIPISESYFLRNPRLRANIGLAASAYIRCAGRNIRGAPVVKKNILSGYFYYREWVANAVSFDVFWSMVRMLHAPAFAHWGLVAHHCKTCGSFHVTDCQHRGSMTNIPCPVESGIIRFGPSAPSSTKNPAGLRHADFAIP